VLLNNYKKMFDKNLDKKFDVIVVGAGPAGGQCARELSESGKKVLLIERSSEIGQPNFSSGGTPLETLKDFDLPLSLVPGKWSKLLIGTTSRSKVWDYEDTRGYVFDFKDLKKFLVKESVKNGAKLLIGTSAKEPIVKDGRVVGVTYSGMFGDGELYANVVVDASGPVGVLASKVGLREKVICSPSIGVEYSLINTPESISDTLAFYFGTDYVPHGYGWIFPMGKNTVKIGVAVYNATDNGIGSLKGVLDKFVSQFPELKDAEPIDMHGGSIYINGGIDSYSTDGLIVIGDAGAQINPFAGEGIRHGLHSGRMASDIIIKAIESNDFSKKTLELYDKKWNKYIGSGWKHSLSVSDKIYGSMSNDKINEMMDVISRMSKEDIFEVGFNYNFVKALSLEAVMTWFKDIIKK